LIPVTCCGFYQQSHFHIIAAFQTEEKKTLLVDNASSYKLWTDQNHESEPNKSWINAIMGKSVQFQGIKMHEENAKSKYYLLDNESLKKATC